MQRMIQPKAFFRFGHASGQTAKRRGRVKAITLFAFGLLAAFAVPRQAMAQVGHAAWSDMDFAASGYVAPAGGAHPGLGLGSPNGGVLPVGYFGQTACDAMPGCDSYGGCNGAGGCGGTSGCCGACGSSSGGGLLGGATGGGLLGDCDGFLGDCGWMLGGIGGALGSLTPWEGAELCHQRWYDISAEALFLDRDIAGGNGGVFTTRGVGPGNPVLSANSIDADELEAGMRLSAAVILGPGTNLEVVYMGLNEWNAEASVFGNGDLFSFISEFGTNPPDNAVTPEFDAGFDDTDRSLRQTVRSKAVFHSGELNYRRRTVAPHCRFQGSWLVGLRHIRYDDSLIYETQGENNNAGGGLPRFFSSDSQAKNNFFGPQAGFDLWWNLYPGISLGTGVKGSWLANHVDRRVLLTANSLGTGATPGTLLLTDSTDDTTVAADFEFKLVYRISYSVTLRTAYYATVVDDYAFGSVDFNSTRGFLNAAPVALAPTQFDSLTLQGFSFGAEYMW